MRALWALAFAFGCSTSPCDDDHTCIDSATDAAPSDVGADTEARVRDAAADASDSGASIDATLVDAGPDTSDATAPDAGPLPGFTVVTWNIENFPQATSTPRLVAEIIESERWDLIGVQEISDDAAFLALIDELEDYDGYVSFDDRAFQRNGILFRRDRVRVRNVQRLFERDGYAFPRDPLAADVTFLNEDGSVAFDFAFVVVHLKATLEEESRLRRLDAIEKLDAWARQVMADGENEVVIVGDYNDEASDPAGENVFGPMLGDGYSILTQALDEDAFSFIPFRALIDHVVITSETIQEYGMGTISIAENVRTGVLNYTDNVSDHLPVVARFVP
ncbi:MAG: endonuclease/exonuclease/phosphatase family protein [Polyangiales bacterium]